MEVILMDMEHSMSTLALVLMWHDYTVKSEKNEKKRKSWLEWLFG
jgi:hypothetical protein